MAKTTYGKIQLLLLFLPYAAIFGLEINWMSKALFAGGWAGLVMILMDIKGLLLFPKEARMDLDPEFKASVERGRQE